MSKFIKAAVASSVLVASAMGANAAHAATASADARANILQQVTVTNSTDLDFATIISGASSDTVSVSSAGAVTCGAALVCSGTTTAAAFAVSGTTGQTVDVSSDATVTLNSGGNNMTATLAPSVTTILLDGTDAFTVGGVLTVGANQPDGAYAGTFDVTVNYQ